MLNGIDVSAAGQGANFPWPQYKGKIQFAGIKISEGTSYADPDAAHNIACARADGLTVIGYHFLHAGTDGAEQAEWFLKCAKTAGLKPGDIIAQDAEDGGLDDCTPAVMNLTGAVFRGQIQKHFANYNPLVYTEISMAPSLTALGSCPLWLADLGTPLVTGAGPWKLVSIWQTGQRGVDTDVFNGTSEQLAKLGF